MVRKKNTRYTGVPYIDMYKDGNWKWIVPFQLGVVIVLIMLFKLEM